MDFFIQLMFARFYMPTFLPDTEKAIYLDDDVIVQGINSTSAFTHMNVVLPNLHTRTHTHVTREV